MKVDEQQQIVYDEPITMAPMTFESEYFSFEGEDYIFVGILLIAAIFAYKVFKLWLKHKGNIK